MKNCQVCKKPYKPRGQQKFCDPCRNKPRKCEKCKKPFVPKSQNDTLRFCSTICRDENQIDVWAAKSPKQRTRKK